MGIGDWVLFTGKHRKTFWTWSFCQKITLDDNTKLLKGKFAKLFIMRANIFVIPLIKARVF